MKWGIVAAIITYLIVIIEPYKGINHNKINVYHIKQEYIEEVMEVYEQEEETAQDWQEYLDRKYPKKEESE